MTDDAVAALKGGPPAAAVAVPDWVPELSAGIRADVYPVSPLPPAPLPAELVLDRDTVTSGYATHRPPYEFASLLSSAPPSPAALTKVRHALAALRKAPPPALQRAPLASGALPGAEGGGSVAASTIKPSFPLQKPSARSSLEDWFNRLASGGAFSTSALSKAVPLGPAIVRAVGKVLEMMAARAVPTQRAVWYIRIAVLNECVKQIRPDRPAPSPRVFWTRQLCGLLKAELDALRSKRAQPSREYFMHYVLDLARWQADESLLNTAPWLDAIIAAVRSDFAHGGSLATTPASRVALRAVETFAPEFAASPAAARRLVDVLATCINACGGAKAIDSPAATDAAAASAAVAASAVSASLASGQSGAGDGVATILPSVTTNERLPPAARLSALLRALLPSIQNGDVEACANLSTLLMLAKNSPATPARPVVGLPEEKGLSHTAQTLFVSRLLERIPVTGDIVGVCDTLREAYSRDDSDGRRESVSFLCAWAVRGPMRASLVAVPIAASLVACLALDMPQCNKAGQIDCGPVFQPEIWAYAKSMTSIRSGDSSALASAESSEDGVTQHDEYGHFVSRIESEEDSRMVCLLAQLYRLNQFDLGSYLKEVGRLVSISHPSASRHLFYIASFPEPGDRSVADSRRSLLRRGHRLCGKSLTTTDADDDAVAAVTSSDVDAAVTHGIRIRAAGDHAVVLVTTEAVLGLDDVPSQDLLEQRVLSTVAFLSSCGAQVVAVNWLLDALSGKPNAFVNDSAALCAMVYALDNLAPFALSSGQLEPCLACLVSLYVQHDANPEAHEKPQMSVLLAIESTAASFGARLASRPGFGRTNYTAAVASVTAKPGVSRRLIAAMLLGKADAANELPDTVLAADGMQRDAHNVSHTEPEKMDILDGPTPDEDVATMESASKLSTDLKALDEFVSFRGVDDEEAAPPGLGPWVTANAVIGSVVVPAIKRAFLAAETDSKHLGSVINASMELLREGVFEHDLCGARATLALELVALLSAAAVKYPSETSSLLVKELLSSTWMRPALLASAGVDMVRRLRLRLASLLGEDENAVVVTRQVLDCCVTLFGDPFRSLESTAVDEGAVIRLLSLVEWGMAEALLTAIIEYRISCSQVEAVGGSLGESAAGIRFCNQARMLVDIIARAVPSSSLDPVVLKLTNVTLEGLTQGLSALIAHAAVQARPDGQSVPRLEREGWAKYDATRGATVTALLPFIKLPATNVVSSISRQLVSGTAVLQAAGVDELRPDLSSDGEILSSAISSRFEILEAILTGSDLSQKDVALSTKVSVKPLEESSSDLREDAAAIRECALAVAGIMTAAAPLLTPSCLSAGLSVLSTAVAKAEQYGVAVVSIPSNVESNLPVEPESKDPSKKSPQCVALRAQIWSSLSHVMGWLNSLQQSTLRSLCSRSDDVENAMSARMHIYALKADGREVDPWYLLEGYGRGPEEQAAIPPEAFDLQRDFNKARHSAEPKAAPFVGEPSVSRLKRTYSTYACMAVR